MSVVSIGLDLAKSVFQVHGVDAAGRTVLRRRLARGELVAFFAKQPAVNRRSSLTPDRRPMLPPLVGGVWW